MSTTRSALTVCGSPKGAKGASWNLGGYLCDRLAEAGGLFTKTRRSLDLAAEALAEGRAIPAEAAALMREDLMPRWIYMAFANVGHFVEGAKHGIAFRMREDPFEKP